jgi:hypothetical protein
MKSTFIDFIHKGGHVVLVSGPGLFNLRSCPSSSSMFSQMVRPPFSGTNSGHRALVPHLFHPLIQWWTGHRVMITTGWFYTLATVNSPAGGVAVWLLLFYTLISSDIHPVVELLDQILVLYFFEEPMIQKIPWLM